MSMNRFGRSGRDSARLRRGRVIASLIAAAALAMAPALAGVVTMGAEARDGAALTASKTTGLDPAGESVTVDGTGFQPNIGLYLVVCDADAAPGSACDMANFKQVTTDAAGSFHQAITVGSFAGTDCTVKNCALMTSKIGAGGDASQTAKLPLSFGDAPAAAALTGSKTSGLDPAGEEITVNGTGFQPNIGLFLALCDADAAPGSACDMVRFKQVTTDASGSFHQAITVGSFTGTDCTVKNCALMTSKVGAGSDASQTATLPLTFTSAPPPTGSAAMSVSKTTGVKSSGDDLKVTGSGFQPNIGLYLALCNTDVPNGGACDMANFKQIRTDADGNFPSTTIHVAGTFSAGNGSTVDCLTDPCALQTSKVGAGADASQQVTVPLEFVQTAAPSLAAPKSAKSGSTVKVKGSDFTPGTKIVTALCQKNAPAGKNCWLAKSKTSSVSDAGAFATKIKVASSFKSPQGKVKCGTKGCAIKTWNAAKPSDSSSQVVHPLKFSKRAGGTSVFVRAGGQLSVSKTSGLNPAGETVTVKGSGYNANVGLYVALCNTNVPNGGACDMGNFKQVHTDASGSFSTTSIKVVSSFTGGDGSSVDCMTDPCALQTSQVGAGTEGVTAVSMKFAADSGSDGGDDSGSGTDNGSGTGTDNGTGGDTDGTTTGTDVSTGEELPATGAGNEPWIAAVGLLLLLGGFALARRPEAPTVS